ncbi:hypothetical protein Tco_0662700 [Tanacetum coccineum]
MRIASLMENPTGSFTSMAVPKITSGFTKTIPPPPSFFNPLPQQATPTPTPITSEATTSFPSLPDFSSVFRFNNRVTNLEKDLSEINQVDQGVETTVTKIETPPLDQTEGQKEGNQAKKLSHPEIQEEPSHTVDDSGVQQDQEFDMGANDEQPADTEVTKDDWFKKPERPPTPNFDWDKRQP